MPLTMVQATRIEREVIATIRTAALHGKSLDGKAYASTDTVMFYNLILQYGRRFEPRALPDYLRTVQAKTLYQRCRWATKLALSHQGSLRYCEGFCYLGKDIFPHAWVTNGRYVYDNTIDLSKVKGPKVYVGIEYTYEVLKQALVDKRDYGIYFFRREHGRAKEGKTAPDRRATGDLSTAH